MSRGVVLVLGASGFIGRHVSRALREQGYKVRGIGHGAWLEDEWLQWGLSSWRDSTITPESLVTASGGDEPYAVVHCAGSGTVASSYRAPYEEFVRSVDSTAILLNVVQRDWAGKTRVVVLSSAAIYGDRGTSDLDETVPPAPISPYGFHKMAAEQLGETYSQFFGINVSVVRLFSVYGEHLRKQLLWDALRKFSRNESTFFGTGNELRDWVHVEDVARLLCGAIRLDLGPHEVFNCGGVKASTREVLGELAMIYGTERQPIFSGEVHPGNPLRLTAECSRAQRILGWHPTIGLHEGLARYVSWFKSFVASS